MVIHPSKDSSRVLLAPAADDCDNGGEEASDSLSGGCTWTRSMDNTSMKQTRKTRVPGDARRRVRGRRDLETPAIAIRILTSSQSPLPVVQILW